MSQVLHDRWPETCCARYKLSSAALSSRRVSWIKREGRGTPLIQAVTNRDLIQLTEIFKNSAELTRDHRAGVHKDVDRLLIHRLVRTAICENCQVRLATLSKKHIAIIIGYSERWHKSMYGTILSQQEQIQLIASTGSRRAGQ